MYTDMHTEAHRGGGVGSGSDIRTLGEPDWGQGPVAVMTGRAPLKNLGHSRAS